MTGPERNPSGVMTLLEQLRQNYRADEGEDGFVQTENRSVREQLPDGYIRLTAVQPYRDRPESMPRRKRWIPVLCGLAVCLVLAGIILWRVLQH